MFFLPVSLWHSCIFSVCPVAYLTVQSGLTSAGHCCRVCLYVSLRIMSVFVSVLACHLSLSSYRTGCLSVYHLLTWLSSVSLFLSFCLSVCACLLAYLSLFLSVHFLTKLSNLAYSLSTICACACLPKCLSVFFSFFFVAGFLYLYFIVYLPVCLPCLVSHLCFFIICSFSVPVLFPNLRVSMMLHWKEKFFTEQTNL